MITRVLGAAVGMTFMLALALGQPASADGVDRTYVVGDEVWTIVTDPSDGRVFVALGGAATGVAVIDSVSGQVTQHATTGTPNYLALDSPHRRLYVSNHFGLLDVFDLTTMTIEATLPVGGGGVAVDPITRRVYVAGGTDLWVVDGATNTVVASRPALADQNWVALALDPSLHQVYVGNVSELSDGAGILRHRSLVVLDDRDLSVVADLQTDLFVRYALAVDEVRHRVYLADSTNSSQSTLLVIDGSTRTQIGSVVLPGFAGGIAVGSAAIYVTAVPMGYHVLDAETFQVTKSMSTLPIRPLFPTLHRDGRLYVSAPDSSGPDTVVAISTSNHAPIISAASLSPSVPTTNDNLSFNVMATDGDFADLSTGQHDPVTVVYEWKRNGVLLAGESSSTLDLSRAGVGDRGDTMSASVNVSDPQGLTASASASVIVANAPPIPTATLSSTSPGTNDMLTATASASDADGDPVTLSFQWLRNGAVVPGATTSSLDLATYGDQGDVIEVRVTASDDHGGVGVAAASALVLPVSGSFLYLQSQPGDFVGRGLTQLYMSSNSAIQGWLPQGGDTFRADITQGTAHYWRVFLAAPAGVPLAVGSYTGAARSAFRPPGSPGLDVSGDGRGCNTLTGQFTVSEIAYSQFNELMLFDATFEQHCEGATPALLGRIRVEIPPPTPGVTLPAGSITVPTSGNFLYLHSEPAEYVGQGSEVLYTSADSKIYSYLPEGGDYFRGNVVQGNNAHWWYVDIAAPPGEPLAVGSYIRAVRAAFRPAGSPGLDVYGDGRQCSTSNAKFDIDELTFAFGELVVFQATFQQPCGTGSLYGRIRIEIPPPSGPGITLPVGSITVPTSGSFLYLNSEPGEYVGRGIEQLYTSADSTITGSFLTQVRDYFRGNVVQGNNVHWWMVDIAAPAGEPLAVGNYLGAARASFRPAGSPGLDVAGDLRGYNELVGRFDVDELSFWSNGELKVFQATFRIGGAEPKLYGRFRLQTPPPLQLGVTIGGDGSVTNKTIVATIGGTVSCSTSVPVDISGTLTQTQAKGVVASGVFSVRVDCAAPSVAWSANVLAESGKFIGGSATATVTASGCRTGCTTASATRTVKLNLGK